MASALLACANVFVPGAGAEIWRSGYLPGWEQTNLPASAVDFSVVTHLIHFSLKPNADGTLNSEANGITRPSSAELVASAHAAGRKALICVGGAGSGASFQAATSGTNLSALISNLTNFIASRDYDGVDLDWEPLAAVDGQAFTQFVNRLRSALDAFPQHKLLTAAVGAYPPYGDPAAAQYDLLAGLQNKFDQINIMTYDLSGPYSGWVTWFNSPIYDGGFRFPSSGGLVPSVSGSVTNFIASGMRPGKLGIGVAFFGYVWTGGAGTSTGGVTLPCQSWTNPPSVIMPSFNAIMATYYQSNFYNWDDNAQAAYLSIANTNPANDRFISYDDQRTCQAKVSYVRSLGLGGIMMWELAQDHQSGQPDALLQSLKPALGIPTLSASLDVLPVCDTNSPASPRQF
ncbi:MAG: glycoside hydrolase family 18 protein [Verrucomicrobiota bacterium]